MSLLLTNATIATMSQTQGAAGYGLIPDGALVIEGEQVVWVGPRADVPGPYDRLPGMDLGGRLITPGLIDCHSHIVFGGDRAAEFEMRLNGASYEQVARAGGGILSTVTATRAASEAELLAQALARADQIMAGGATVIEVKSGYGLTVADEVKLLRVARRIGELRAVRVLRVPLAGWPCCAMRLIAARRWSKAC